MDNNDYIGIYNESRQQGENTIFLKDIFFYKKPPYTLRNMKLMKQLAMIKKHTLY